MKEAIKGDKLQCGRVFLNNNQLNDVRYKILDLITDVIGLIFVPLFKNTFIYY